jgi:hypothetical protein
LKKMLDQAYLFQDAGREDHPEQALAERFPELLAAAMIIEARPHAFGLLPGQSALSALADMYLRYGREWNGFPRGWHSRTA